MLKHIGRILFVLAIFGAGLFVGLGIDGQSQAASSGCRIDWKVCTKNYLKADIYMPGGVDHTNRETIRYVPEIGAYRIDIWANQ